MADWTELEVELIVADYFLMLHSELNGIKYNKTEHRNKLIPLLNNRDKAIEFKHMNISAVLIKNGYPYIAGYKPLWSFQALLEEKVLKYLERTPIMEKDFKHFTTQKIEQNVPKIEFKSWIEKAPEEKKIVKERTVTYRTFVKRNYLELEQKNQSIGKAGEQLVFNYEKWRLTNSGFPKLAKEVKWISKDLGDGTGYDILSKNTRGADIFIEVKTTTLGKETPIFFSKGENDFSNEKKEEFNLYRVFNLKDKPKMFRLNGRFKDFCRIEAINFKGFF